MCKVWVIYIKVGCVCWTANFWDIRSIHWKCTENTNKFIPIYMSTFGLNVPKTKGNFMKLWKCSEFNLRYRNCSIVKAEGFTLILNCIFVVLFNPRADNGIEMCSYVHYMLVKLKQSKIVHLAGQDVWICSHILSEWRNFNLISVNPYPNIHTWNKQNCKREVLTFSNVFPVNTRKPGVLFEFIQTSSTKSSLSTTYQFLYQICGIITDLYIAGKFKTGLKHKNIYLKLNSYTSNSLSLWVWKSVYIYNILVIFSYPIALFVFW